MSQFTWEKIRVYLLDHGTFPALGTPLAPDANEIDPQLLVESAADAPQ